ncbi:MAG: rod-binding protein [Desulfobacteraceae bacterium]|nr:rod-binding protein [Desulfobacteraceae bacterium]
MENLAIDPRIAIGGSGEVSGGRAEDREALKQVCQDFEAVFINTLFKQMRKTIPDQGYLEHGMGMEMFEELMDTEVARDMAQKGGFGLGRLLYEQMQDL